MEYLRVVGENIRAVRRAEGMEVEELAEAVRVSPEYIQRLEEGGEDVTLRVLVEVAKVLKSSVHDLTAGI